MEKNLNYFKYCAYLYINRFDEPEFEFIREKMRVFMVGESPCILFILHVPIDEGVCAVKKVFDTNI